jgi:hypothetical protein
VYTQGVAQLSKSIPIEKIFASQLQDDDEHSRGPAITSTATISETRSFDKSLASTFKKVRASESTHQQLLDKLLGNLSKLATPALHMGAPQTTLLMSQVRSTTCPGSDSACSTFVVPIRPFDHPIKSKGSCTAVAAGAIGLASK